MLKRFLGFGWNVAKHGDGQSENDSWIHAVRLDVEINGEMQTQLVLELIINFLRSDIYLIQLLSEDVFSQEKKDSSGVKMSY